MNPLKVAAIVPALNEEMSIGKVLKVLLRSPELAEVIVVDDGSTDETAKISRELGAKVISLPQKGGSGKGNAMRQGVKSTKAGVILFCDADLINLSPEHISLLLEPIFKNEAVMSIGIRGRHGLGKIAEFFIKIDPLLATGGERVMRRNIFEALPVRLIEGFMVETALNNYCKINNLPVSYVKLKGLKIVIKERKWGFLKGLLARLRMYQEVFRIRTLVAKAGKK